MTAALVADDTVAPRATFGPFSVVGIDGPGIAEPTRFGADAMVRSHVVVYRGVVAGDRLHLGHGALVREHTRIGHDVSLGSHTVVEHHVTIGDGVRLHTGVFVPEHSILEQGAWLGPGVTVTNARYPNRPDTKERLEAVSIERDAVIGAGAVLLPGITVGARAIVGAGAVVVRDVLAGTTVVGNPAVPT